MSEITETEEALAAMKRAAAVARERAARFGSKLVLWRDGAVVLVDPDTKIEESVGEAGRSIELEETSVEK